LALPRPWKFADGKALQALVTHRPRGQSPQRRIPPVNTPPRRTLWVDATRARRRHLGDVTVVLSTRRRHDGPNRTNILVPHRPASVTARARVGVYLRRWWVELWCRALTGVVGVGPHQVTHQVARVERAVAVAIMASLLLRQWRAKDIPADRPGSACHLQRALAWDVVQAQCERSARQRARQWLHVGNAA
jgi:hypothetical protein